MDDWFDGAGNGNAVDVAALLDSDSMPRLIDLVAAGAMVSLSRTSDGGALGVTITVDGRWRREYFRTAETLDEWTELAMAPVHEALERRAASGEPRTRQRRSRGL